MCGIIVSGILVPCDNEERLIGLPIAASFILNGLVRKKREPTLCDNKERLIGLHIAASFILNGYMFIHILTHIGSLYPSSLPLCRQMERACGMELEQH